MLFRSAAQNQLTAAYNQYLNQLNYPKTQLDWLSTQIRGLAPDTVTGSSTASTSTGNSYSASPLSQLASGLLAYNGATKSGLLG